MSRCAACGSPKAFLSMGGVIVCRECEPEVRARMELSREKTGRVNVSSICREIFKKTNPTGDFLLRDFPTELKKRAEHRAVDESCSVREIFLRALEKYLSK